MTFLGKKHSPETKARMSAAQKGKEFPSDRARKNATVHGMHGTPEYSSWRSMRTRCTNPNVVGYPRYGGRGITVCNRWWAGEGGRSAFECFYADMGPRPGKKFSLDRIDNNGNYEPSNCRWATVEKQAASRRYDKEAHAARSKVRARRARRDERGRFVEMQAEIEAIRKAERDRRGGIGVVAHGRQT
jgi:NUMOD3 motif